MPVDEAEDGDAADYRRSRWNRRPGERVLDGQRRAGRGADAAGKRAREAFGEIAWRVPRQVLEQIEPQIAAKLDKRARRGPPGKPPEEVVSGDQSQQNADRRP